MEEEASSSSHRGKALAVLTSGGDSQGMNAAVRAVVRFGFHLGSKVFLVHEGYQGLVNGGDMIAEASWSDVSSIIHQGGTIIGTARCMEFKERSGRLKAAKNLVDRGIQKLIVIGGDGSLTGANIFREEWGSLLDELEATKQIGMEQMTSMMYLNIVGIVGSIDNDFSGTDLTIGSNSALHRIIEAVDNLVPTAKSHQRTFILECMGRRCGFIALAAAIATEADYLFIPEWPPDSNWPEQLCRKLQRTREQKQRLNIIILAEKATVKKVVVDKLGHDARITVLGHIQRGGAPSVLDRVLGSRMGAEAVIAILKAKEDTAPSVVALTGNAIVLVPLMEAVHETQKIAQCLRDKDWDTAIQSRGRAFERNLEVYRRLSKYQPKSLKPTESQQATVHCLAVLQVGSPAGGMNAAVNAFVRNTLITGDKAYAVMNGIEGLYFQSEGLTEMDWQSVNGWISQGGANLGSKETLPEGKFGEIAAQLGTHKIQGIAIIGGFEAFLAMVQLQEQSSKYPEFRIPMVVIPATISNNVPGTEISVGADTALNIITTACDSIRQSAEGTKRRVFVVETMGGYCGYLSTLSGLASGADAVYIGEEKFDIARLSHDLDIIRDKMLTSEIQRGLILTNQYANENYSTDFIRRLYAKEGEGIFTSRANVIGHVQQGGNPSVFDRNLGIKMATKAHKWLLDQIERKDETPKASVIGLMKEAFVFTPVEDLIRNTDVEHRIWKESPWWMQLRSLTKILANYKSHYYSESKQVPLSELKQVL